MNVKRQQRTKGQEKNKSKDKGGIEGRKDQTNERWH